MTGPQFLITPHLQEKSDLLKLKLKTKDNTENELTLVYTDFNIKAQSSNVKRDYMSFLNADSIKLINTVYKQDFDLFGYPMVENK